MLVVTLRIILAFTVLTALYMAISIYMRWDRMVSLREEYDAGAAPNLTREDYVAKGLAKYERSWVRRALYGVFLIPLVVGLILIALAEFNGT